MAADLSDETEPPLSSASTMGPGFGTGGLLLR